MPRTATRPNVILILSDDQGYGDLACYGNPGLATPNLDRLAEQGLRLDQHYSASPLCAPARGALLTGRYNHRVGALSVESNRGLDRISLQDITIADRFAAAGYATGMVGKWHSGLFDRHYHPNSRGFREFVGFLNGGMDYFDWILERNGTSERSDGRYLTDVFTDEAVAFIHRHRSHPFFLHLAYNAPHAPLQAPEDELKRYRDRQDLSDGARVLYAMIERLDKGVGRVLDALQQENIADNTIVLFTSDNGPWLGRADGYDCSRFNGPFRGMKQDVLEGGIRVPALVRWADGLPAGREVAEMMHFCDWLPTLAAACGVGVEEAAALDGVNALAALRGERTAVLQRRFWQFNRYEPVPHCNAAMRDGDWKLFWPFIPEARRKLTADNACYQELFRRPHFERPLDLDPVERTLSAPGQPELYNIAEDPAESRNLAADQPDRLKRMIDDLDKWFDQVNRERLALPEYRGRRISIP